MGICYYSCDNCGECYADCWDNVTTECEDYTFCDNCVSEYELNIEEKLNDEWLLKKEFYNIKEVKTIKKEFTFKK